MSLTRRLWLVLASDRPELEGLCPGLGARLGPNSPLIKSLVVLDTT
jgi:hypothetical protein